MYIDALTNEFFRKGPIYQKMKDFVENKPVEFTEIEDHFIDLLAEKASPLWGELPRKILCQILVRGADHIANPAEKRLNEVISSIKYMKPLMMRAYDYYEGRIDALTAEDREMFLDIQADICAKHDKILPLKDAIYYALLGYEETIKEVCDEIGTDWLADI